MHRTISVDESMICFKWRSSLWGYKVRIRADVSGYIDEFQIYSGKSNETAEKQLGPRVIKDLTRSLMGKLYSVYFDKLFYLKATTKASEIREYLHNRYYQERESWSFKRFQNR